MLYEGGLSCFLFYVRLKRVVFVKDMQLQVMEVGNGDVYAGIFGLICTTIAARVLNFS